MNDSEWDSRDLLSKIIRGGLLGIVGQVASRLIQFFFLLLLARFLTQSEYGLFILGWIVVTTAQSVSSLGLDKGVVRFVSMYDSKGDQKSVRGTFISAIVLSGLMGTALAYALNFGSDIIAIQVFKKSGLSRVYSILPIIIPFWTVTLINSSLMQSYKNIVGQQFIINARTGLILIFSIFAILAGYELEGLLIAVVLSGVATFLVSVLIVVREISISIIGPVSFNTRKLLLFSTPTFLSGFIYSLLYKIDQVFLGVLDSATNVAVYNVASILSSQLTIFLIALGAIFEPIASEVYSSGDIKELQRIFQNSSIWVFIASLPAVSILWSFPTVFLSLFGAQYISGKPILIILAVYPLIRISIGPTGELLQMTGNQNILLLDALLMVTINVFLNLVLIPIFGPVGAAVSTTISIGAVEVIVLYQVYRRLGVHPFSSRYGITVVIGAGLLTISFLSTWSGIPFLMKAVIMSSSLGVFICLIWVLVLYKHERQSIYDIFQGYLA